MGSTPASGTNAHHCLVVQRKDGRLLPGEWRFESSRGSQLAVAQSARARPCHGRDRGFNSRLRVHPRPGHRRAQRAVTPWPPAVQVQLLRRGPCSASSGGQSAGVTCRRSAVRFRRRAPHHHSRLRGVAAISPLCRRGDRGFESRRRRQSPFGYVQLGRRGFHPRGAGAAPARATIASSSRSQDVGFSPRRHGCESRRGDHGHHQDVAQRKRACVGSTRSVARTHPS